MRAQEESTMKNSGWTKCGPINDEGLLPSELDLQAAARKGAAAHNFPVEKDGGGAALSRPRHLFERGSCVRPLGRVFSFFLK